MYQIAAAEMVHEREADDGEEEHAEEQGVSAKKFRGPTFGYRSQSRAGGSKEQGNHDHVSSRKLIEQSLEESEMEMVA